MAIVPSLAHAQEGTTTTPIEEAGPAAFARGQSAWDKKEYDRAETSYQEAIEQGGLGPEEVREAYVKLGSARALRGKNDAAVRAFRAAAVLEDFKIPAQLRANQAKLAEQAKRDVQRLGIGAMSFTAQAPDKTAPARAFNVKVTLDEKHVKVVSFISMSVRESGGKNLNKQEAPAETLEIEVPAHMAPPGAQITVRVDALDKYKNRLATAEARVTVDSTVEPSAKIDIESTTKKVDTVSRKSIFSTPWPYVIGGIVLLGAGAAFVVQTQKANEVSIGSVGVKAQ
jgi:hypothetical protein